jgi:hypothetical protein
MHVLLKELKHLKGPASHACYRSLESLLIRVILEDKKKIVGKFSMDRGVLTGFHLLCESLN